MDHLESIVKHFFGNEVTERDRAVFEAGIKLGASYHQFTGIPLSKSNISTIEKAIEEAVACQPYVESIIVKIKPPESGDLNSYGYSEVNEKNLSIRLVVRYGHVRVSAGMEYIPELNYPLMFIEKLEENVNDE